MVTVAATALATRDQLLPEVIDISIIPIRSGVASLVVVSYGALRRFRTRSSVSSRYSARWQVASVPPEPSRWHSWAMYSKSLMFRALAPHLLIAMLIAMGGGLAYGLGGPAWFVYAALFVSALAVLHGYIRWDERQRSRR